MLYYTTFVTVRTWRQKLIIVYYNSHQYNNLDLLWGFFLVCACVYVCLLTLFCFIGIQITQGPSNITAYVGESVTLQCLYTGTFSQPKWRIGGTTYTSSNPPAGYEYTDEGLHIPSVWEQLNNTVHVCFFTAFVAKRGRIENIESQPAIITIMTRSKQLNYITWSD